MAFFDERELKNQLLFQNAKEFYNFVSRYDEEMIPVDEKLGLQKNVRFSWEFMYQVAKLSTLMPYDKVTQVIQLTYHISITKPIVVKAVKICEKLLEEREGYRYYEENKEVRKRKAQVIYIEGDGVMV